MSSSHNATQLYFLLHASASTGTVTNSTLNFDLPLNYMHKGCLILISRTAESGTCTLDAHIEFYAPGAGTWQDLEGATFHQFADGETGDRYLMVYPGLVGSDADSHVELDTDEAALCGQYLPRQCRLAVATGGTSVSNTFSAEGWLLP